MTVLRDVNNTYSTENDIANKLADTFSNSLEEIKLYTTNYEQAILDTSWIIVCQIFLHSVSCVTMRS